MVSFYEQISKDNYLILENNKFTSSPISPSGSDDYLKKCDLLVIAKICNKDRDFDNKLYHNTIKTYKFVDIDPSRFDEYRLFEPHIYEEIVKNRLDMMNDFWRANKNSNLFVKALEYYKKYGKRQYDFLKKLELQPIDTAKGPVFLKFKDTRTGRLASDENSELNIYNMPLRDRNKIIVKSGHFILQFDFIACQMRIYFAIVGHELAKYYDPYAKISKDIGIHRQDAKLYSFKMLFGDMGGKIRRLTKEQNTYFVNMFSKKIYDDNSCSIGSYIYDTFGRPVLITSQSKSVVMNNLMQCEERNTLMNSMCEVDDYLKSNNVDAKILFPFHDAMVMSISQKDLIHIKKIRNVFEQSKMFSKISIGKNFGEMKEIVDKRALQQ
jgi:DNA polymerase I-like protein with 3'-5' exonuclease and polymerase domains